MDYVGVVTGDQRLADAGMDESEEFASLITFLSQQKK